MGQYFIKDIETLSGIKAHTLRIWEQRYNMLIPERTDTNIRYYTDTQLREVLNIALLNKNGVKISKIAAMNPQQIIAEVMRISQHTQQTSNLIDALVIAMVDFNEARFEKTLQTSILKLGLVETFCQLIFPFLSRTGVLWTTGAVTPAQEHFISHLIRRKLCAAIDTQFVSPSPSTRKFALYLPEGEWHDLLLLFSEYLLRSYHHQVVYLGTSLPMDELHEVVRVYQPDYLLTFMTVSPMEMPLDQYIRKLVGSFTTVKVLLSGAQVTVDTPLPPTATRLGSIQDLKNLLEEIKEK
jgi:MerR family transcriptional regulator, light-induced transcriptional regulator